MFRGTGSGGEGVGAMKVSVCGRWMFGSAGKVCIGVRSAFSFSLYIIMCMSVDFLRENVLGE